MLKSRGLANGLKLYPTLNLTVFSSLLKTLAHLELGELKTAIQKTPKKQVMAAYVNIGCNLSLYRFTKERDKIEMTGCQMNVFPKFFLLNSFLKVLFRIQNKGNFIITINFFLQRKSLYHDIQVVPGDLKSELLHFLQRLPESISTVRYAESRFVLYHFTPLQKPSLLFSWHLLVISQPA